MIKNLGQYKHSVLFFDIDGTLINSYEGVKKCVEYACSRFGFCIPSDEVLPSFVGPPIEESFAKHLHCDDKTIVEMAEAFRNYYRMRGYRYGRLYDNVREVLIRNDRIKKCVVTNKNKAYAKKTLEYFKICSCFEDIYSADASAGLRKGNILSDYLLSNNILGNQGLMIGDTIEDYEAAKTSGCDFLGVTYGFGLKSNLEYSFPIINSFSDIERYF